MYIRRLRWIKDNIGSDEYYKKSGLVPSSLWVYPKLKWIIDNKPKLYEKTWKFVNGQEFILNHLGSKETFTVPSALNYNGMFDVQTLDWSHDLLDARGLLFFPFFNSQATPYYHDNARGRLIGITQVHDRKNTARAVLEGIIYELRMTVEAMEESLGRPFETIRLSGGGARSEFWCQMQADIYERPVERLKVSECAALGAAILGGVGSGEIDNIDNAIDRMIHTHGIIEPDMENHKIYTEFYQVFRDTFLALRDANICNDLAEVDMKYGG